ncbi:MAG: hypothetical protein QGI78_06240 [Phycisphaerales bacterium]|jgi:hypothetical protein|nr:hypothetical protein [Phycisphaerales bacterium]
MKTLLFLFLIFVCGCNATHIQGTELRLEMNAPQQAVLFVVRNDEVSYGGGLHAVENTTTWHGSMNDSQKTLYDKYISMLDTSHGFTQEGVGKYTICIKKDFEQKKLVLPLTDKTATKMYDLLMKVADARLNATLDALPKPSVDALLQNRGLGETQ